MLLIVLLTLADIGPRPMPNTPGPMKPEPKRTFADGPALEPADALQRWLDAQVDAAGKPKRVRLPVVVMQREHGLERTGFVGSEKGLALQLDDSSMGVSLADHFHRVCKDATRCVLLLDGTVQKGSLRILWIQGVKGDAPTKAQVEVP